MRNSISKIARRLLSLLLNVFMAFTMILEGSSGIATKTVNAKEIGNKNETQLQVCNFVKDGSAPSGYEAILGEGDKSVYRGGRARSGLQDGTSLDTDPNDFAAPLPYGNVFVDTNKLNWFTPSNFIIDIKDDRFKWVAVDDKQFTDAVGHTTTNDPLGLGYSLKGRTPNNGGGLDPGAITNGFIAYVGELKPYHDDIKAKTDSTGVTNSITPKEGNEYLYQITYLNAATLADGTKGNVVMTMTQVDIETSMSVSEDNPRKLIDKNGNEYSYTKAVMPIQDANNLRVASGVVDSEGNWVNEPYIVVKTKDEVQASIDEANAKLPNGQKIGVGMAKDKMVRHTAGGAYTFEIKVVDSQGNPAEGTMAYAANDLDLPSYQNLWGRDGSDPFMYSEGLSIVKGSQSYAVVPEYNHSGGDTINTGWVPKGLGDSWGSPLDIKKEGSGSNADGVSFRSNGEKVLRDKNGLWKDAFTSWNEINNEDPMMAIPDGSIRDFMWNNLNNARLRDKANLSTTPLNDNVKKQLAGKIDKPWDQITAEDAVAYLENGSYAVERGDDSTFDAGFAVLIDPAGTTFRWTGSSYNSGQAVTKLFDSTLFTYIEQTHGTGGGIYVESYDVGNQCEIVMNEGTVTMSRQSETTLTAVPEKGYRVNRILIGDTNYGEGSNVHGLQDYTEYVIDGNEIKVNGTTVGTFTGTETVTDFDDLKTGVIELDGFKFIKNPETNTEERVATAGKKIRIERNADGTVDITLPEVDNPMHVHVDFGTDYYFYKVWVGEDEPTELKLTAAPYGFFPVEVTIPMPTGAVDSEGIAITEDVVFKIDKNEYTATNGVHEGKKFTLTPNGTILYSEIDGEGQETVHIESTYVLKGNEFVNDASGDKRQVTIEEKIADWKSKYAVSFKVDDTDEYKKYVTVSTEGDNTVWKIRYPSEGVSVLNWKELPADVTGERTDEHDAATHTDRNYWFVIEDNAPAWTLESYDSSAAKIPGVVPNVEGKDGYYNSSQWAADATKNVEKATKLVQEDNKNTAAFLSVFEDGGKITNVPMAVVKGVKEWDDLNNKYNNRKDIWLHVDATIGSTTTKDILPAQKIAPEANGDGLIKTWGDKKEYETGVDTVKVVASRKDIPSKAKKQDNGSYVLDTTTYWVNELKKVDANGKTIEYTVRETLDSEGNQPVEKDNIDQGLLGYISTDAVTWDKMEQETINSDNKKVQLYKGTLKNTLELVNVQATKVWDDNNDQDGYRQDITFELKGIEAELPNNQSKTVEIKKDATGNALVAKWTGLPRYVNGEKVEFSIQETPGLKDYQVIIDSKEVKAKAEGENDTFEFTVTNKHTPETASISIFKEWDDTDNQDGLRKEAAKVLLEGKTASESQYKSVSDQEGNGIVQGIVPVEDGLVITWLNIPVKRKGEDITYKIHEDVAGLGGYYTDPTYVDEEFTLTNGENKEATITNKQTPEVTEITVTKEWDDMDDHDGIRPDSVTVKLNKTYQAIVPQTKEVDKEVTVNDAKYPVKKVGDVEYFEIDGKYYRADEIEKGNGEVTDYEELIVGENDFNPTADDETVKVKVADEPQYEEKTEVVEEITLSESNSWTKTVSNLAVNAPEGQKITYSVSEDDVPEGYEATVTSTEAGKYTVTNKHEVIINPPVGEPEVTEDYKGKPQTSPVIQFTPDPDTLGPGGTENKIERVTLVDEDGNEVNTVTVPGEGTYVLNEDGTITFTPEPDFVGKTSGVKVRGYDSNGLSADTTYTPTVKHKVKYVDPLNPDGEQVVEGPRDCNTPDASDDSSDYEGEPGTESKNHPGYRFDGWDEEEVDDPDHPGDKITVRTAKYTPMYNINYDPNGGEGEMDDNNYVVDDPSMPHDKNTFTRKGYTFEGFKAYITDPTTGEETPIVDENGDPIIFKDANDMAKYFEGKPGGTSIRMEAQWKKNEYHIHYDANGGEGEMSSQDFTGEDTSAKSKDNEFTRPGHKFIGFKAQDKDGNYLKDENGNDIIFTSEEDFIEYLHEQGDGGEITLVAQWEPLPWVKYIDEDGNTVYMDPTYFDGKEPQAPADPTKEGYKFTGWTREVDENGNVTYTAQWEPLNWVKYVDEDGKTIYMDPTYFDSNSEDEPSGPNNPTKEGYKFTGWTREVDKDGNITYTAHWEPVSGDIWVKYIDEDGNTIYMDKKYFDPNSKEPAGPPTPTKEGYTFAGWTREVDENGNITYIAHWTKTVVDTSDRTNLTRYYSMMYISIMMMGYVLYIRKKYSKG